MTYEVRWHKLSEEKPPDNLWWRYQWVCTTDGRVIIAQWNGDIPTVLQEGTTLIDGYVRGGTWFDGVTHWAYIQTSPPLPPEDTQ